MVYHRSDYFRWILSWKFRISIDWELVKIHKISLQKEKENKSSTYFIQINCAESSMLTHSTHTQSHLHTLRLSLNLKFFPFWHFGKYLLVSLCQRRILTDEQRLELISFSIPSSSFSSLNSYKKSWLFCHHR